MKVRDMFHNRSLNDNLTDWSLLKHKDFVETILEPTNSSHDHVDTTVHGEIIAHDARFISESKRRTSHCIEAGHEHSYNEYTAQSYFEIPSTQMYHHQNSNISPNIASDISAQPQHTNPIPDASLVVVSRDNSKFTPYVEHTYIDFNKVDERLVTESSCILGEKVHAIVCYVGTLEEDCLDNLYSGTKIHDYSYLGNNT